MIDAWQGVSLFGAAVAAGAINSVAGGGSFFTFPALVLTGMPSIAANATSTVAVWPGTVASVGAYREDIRRERRLLPGLLAVSIIGGLLGAFVLLRTPQPTFDRILPWLLLVATLIFAFGARLARRLGARPTTDGSPARIGRGGCPVRARSIARIAVTSAFSIIEESHMPTMDKRIALCLVAVAALPLASAAVAQKKPAAKSAPAKRPSAEIKAFCYKLYGKAYMLCGTSDHSCKFLAADKWERCEQTGRWP